MNIDHQLLDPAAGSAWLAASNTPAELTASEFLQTLARREISASDYVNANFDRIERFDPVLRAFKCFNRDNAVKRARAIDARLAAGETIMAFSGVLIGVKDIFNTYDFPTGMGSEILEHYEPGNDARVVSNLRLEEGIVAGKTITAEFAVHSPGPTINPWDPRRTPGTSSSGSAVAVATRMVPVALATQTAGSIIRPASYCGVIGFKPSFGLIPRTGVLKTTDTFDTVGFLGRSVEDMRLMFEICRVRGHNYPVSEAALTDVARQAPKDRPWRIAIASGPMSQYETSMVRQGIASFAAKLAGLGCDVFDYRLPAILDDVHAIHERIYQRALAYYFRYEWKTHSHLFTPRMQAMINGGLKISPETYQGDVAMQGRILHDFDETAQQDFDILLCPSTADIAPIGLDAQDLPDHCLIWTFLGVPAISLPLLSGEHGLPVGVQFVSRRFADYKLLDFAQWLTQVNQ